MFEEVFGSDSFCALDEDSSELQPAATFDSPAWFDGKKVNEARFCQKFLMEHPMICVKGSFFTVDGRVNDEDGLRKQIYEMLSPWVHTGLARRVESLMNVMKVEAYQPDLPAHTDRIHVANGTLFLDGRFTEKKEYCRNRLPVAYDPNAAFPPEWIMFLDQLLETKDIYTLQEFMVLCFGKESGLNRAEGTHEIGKDRYAERGVSAV